MKKEQVLNCSFPKWYQDFRSVTVRSRMIDLPDDVVKYLLSDGLVLPHGENHGLSSDLYSDNSESEEEWDIDAKSVEGPKFEKFNDSIRDCISQLGGAVIPKLNWSAPRDATWISFDKSMRCQTPTDVFLLLKSSDFITHDLTDPFRYCEDKECTADDDDQVTLTYQLVLKRWLDIAPQDEFRCFVVNNELVGISQRHDSVFYPSIGADRCVITNDILGFYKTSVEGRFVDTDFVFDVYRKSNGKVILLDFNPFGVLTDGLLFDWDELDRLKSSSDPTGNEPELRCVEDQEGIKNHPYQCYAVPQDFVHLSAGLDPAKFVDLLHINVQKDENSSGEEDKES